ncbi:MAG: hypothetical protein R6U61_00990 [Thermoplasmata archaeon]
MNSGRYGIIVCTGCNYARAVDLTNKTAECTHCGKRMKLKKMKIYFSSDSQEEVRWAVGRINAQIRRGEIPEEEEKQKSVYKKAADEASTGNDQREKLLIIARVLTSELGEFQKEDFFKAVGLLGLDKGEDLIEKLEKLDEVYQPRPGLYKTV